MNSSQKPLLSLAIDITIFQVCMHVCVINYIRTCVCVCKGVSCDYFILQGTLWNALALGKQVHVIVWCTQQGCSKQFLVGLARKWVCLSRKWVWLYSGNGSSELTRAGLALILTELKVAIAILEHCRFQSPHKAMPIL